MDPILSYDQMSKKQIKEMNRERSAYTKACSRFANILSSGQWVSIDRDSQVFNGDKITSWHTTSGQSWRFKKAIGIQLSARNTYYSPAYPEDTNTYSVDWVVQCDPMKKTFIARDPNVPSREAIGQYFPKRDTLQLMINGPAGPLATPDDSQTIWGVSTHYYTHVV